MGSKNFNNDPILHQLGQSMRPDPAKFKERLFARIEKEHIHPFAIPEPSHSFSIMQHSWKLAVGLSLLLALFLGGFYFNTDSPLAKIAFYSGTLKSSSNLSDGLYKDDTLQSSTDGQASVVLSDHSIVRLDQDSIITILKKRQIAIHQGRLFADIAHTPDKARFQIKTPQAVVTVFGTSFEVDCRDNQTAVSVVSGHVKVEWNNQSVMLTKGEKVAVTPSDKKPDIQHGSPLPPQWVDTILKAETKTTVQDAMKQLFPSRAFNTRKNE